MTTAPPAAPSDAPPAAPADPPPGAHSGDQLRDRLAGLLDPADLRLNLMLVSDHRSESAAVFDVPISADLAAELLDQVAQTASAAAEAEFQPVQPGFTPGAAQWVHTHLVDGPLVELEPRVLADSQRQYDRGDDFGRRSLLALRVRTARGVDLARMYQGFSPEKALAGRRRILAFWNGEAFASLDAEPLVIDRGLRLFAFGGTVTAPGTTLLMKSNSAYESLFGALPDLRARAAATFAATFGRLDIVGAAELQAACESDLNMMRKLLSIQHKMEQPGYPAALDMPSVLAFLSRNPHIDVPVDTSGQTPALVFSAQAQHRWALLKLLDDDFLRSDLTNINYEANSKSEVGSV